jgi:hypothetical protein
MGTISAFTAAITNFAKPKLFEVTITLPELLTKKFNDDIKPLLNFEKTLNFKCESTNIPGRTFATTEQKFGSNPTEKHAYHTTYNDIDMTFIVTEIAGKDFRRGQIGAGLPEKQLFDEWMNLINPIDTYDFIYKEKYVSDIKIKEFNSYGDPIYTVSLVDAFPISVNQLDLDWSSDGYHKLNVTFAYTRWITDK